MNIFDYMGVSKLSANVLLFFKVKYSFKADTAAIYLEAHLKKCSINPKHIPSQANYSTLY